MRKICSPHFNTTDPAMPHCGGALSHQGVCNGHAHLFGNPTRYAYDSHGRKILGPTEPPDFDEDGPALACDRVRERAKGLARPPKMSENFTLAECHGPLRTDMLLKIQELFKLARWLHPLKQLKSGLSGDLAHAAEHGP
jgi:hypothetical protein